VLAPGPPRQRRVLPLPDRIIVSFDFHGVVTPQRGGTARQIGAVGGGDHLRRWAAGLAVAILSSQRTPSKRRP